MLELAIGLPFLMLVMLGLIDFGRISYQVMVVQAAARAGAQYGTQTPQSAQLLKL